MLKILVRGEMAVRSLRSYANNNLRPDAGASAVEYALMVGLIAVVIIAGVTLLGNTMNTRFSSVANSV